MKEFVLYYKDTEVLVTTKDEEEAFLVDRDVDAYHRKVIVGVGVQITPELICCEG